MRMERAVELGSLRVRLMWGDSIVKGQTAATVLEERTTGLGGKESWASRRGAQRVDEPGTVPMGSFQTARPGEVGSTVRHRWISSSLLCRERCSKD